MYHILYNSYEEHLGGRDYIGAHSTEDLYDGYLGSYTDPTFNPTGRMIISFFQSRESLIKAEMRLQRTLKVVEDPQYANQAYQTSTGFCCRGAKFPGKNTGSKWSEEAKENRKGEGNPNFGRGKPTGKPPTLTLEGRLAMREKKLGENNPMYGRSGELSPTFRRVKTPEEIELRVQKMKKKRWFVNSHGETRMFDTQPQGEWRPGRLWEED